MTGRKRKHLRYVGLQPRTLRAYRLALAAFLKFLGRRSVKRMKASRLDHYVSEFINLSYQEGEPIAYAGHLLSALKRFHPEFRQELPVATQFYKNWTRSYVPKRAIPAAWELVEAMIGVALSQDQLHMALLLALGFNCMLRTSEMLQLTARHLLLHPGQESFSVVLPQAKTSVGNPQVLQVTDPALVALAFPMLSAIPSRKRSRLLWGQGAHAFRMAFQGLLKKLGFERDSYLPYSLRRGGATWYYQATLSLDATVTRGRWACVKTARQYIDEGTMQLAHVTWSPDQCRKVATWRQKGMRLRQKRKTRT